MKKTFIIAVFTALFFVGNAQILREEFLKESIKDSIFTLHGWDDSFTEKEIREFQNSWSVGKLKAKLSKGSQGYYILPLKGVNEAGDSLFGCHIVHSSKVVDKYIQQLNEGYYPLQEMPYSEIAMVFPIRLNKVVTKIDCFNATMNAWRTNVREKRNSKLKTIHMALKDSKESVFLFDSLMVPEGSINKKNELQILSPLTAFVRNFESNERSTQLFDYLFYVSPLIDQNKGERYVCLFNSKTHSFYFERAKGLKEGNQTLEKAQIEAIRNCILNPGVFDFIMGK